MGILDIADCLAKCFLDSTSDSTKNSECFETCFNQVTAVAFPDYATRKDFYDHYREAVKWINSEEFTNAVHARKKAYEEATEGSGPEWETLVREVETFGKSVVAPRLTSAQRRIDEANPQSYRPWGSLKVTKTAIDRFVDLASK